MAVYASGASLPGDALYPLKTTFEGLQARLTVNPASQSRLYLNFAGRRLDEMQSLIEQKRYADISAAAVGFELDVQQSLTAIKRLSHTDSASAVKLGNETAATLHTYMAALARIHAIVPADVQPVIQHAMQISFSEFADDDDDNSGQGGDDDNNNGNDDEDETPPSTPTTVSTPTATSTPTVILPAPTMTPTLTPQPIATFTAISNDDSSENTGNASDDDNNDSSSGSDTDDDEDDNGDDGDDDDDND